MPITDEYKDWRRQQEEADRRQEHRMKAPQPTFVWRKNRERTTEIVTTVADITNYICVDWAGAEPIPSPLPRMNPIYKQLWIVALRSGDYLPVKGLLVEKVRPDHPLSEGDAKAEMCCLGVACDIDPEIHLRRRRPTVGEIGYVEPQGGAFDEDDFQSTMPGTKARARWGLHDNITNALASMNDSNCQKGQDWFNLLAYWIELNL